MLRPSMLLCLLFIAATLMGTGPASAETCGPIGKERGHLGKYYAYVYGDAPGDQTDYDILLAAVAESDAGGLIWCRYKPAPGGFEPEGFQITDANGVVIEATMFIGGGASGDRQEATEQTSAPLISCQRKTGSCGLRSATRSTCENGALVLTRTDGGWPVGNTVMVQQTRFRGDGVVLSWETKAAGRPKLSRALVAEGVWDGPNCLEDL